MYGLMSLYEERFLRGLPGLKTVTTTEDVLWIMFMNVEGIF